MRVKQVQVNLHNFKHPGIKYKFLKKLGDGSASKIYSSENIETKEMVIVKRINKNEEWRQELNILKSLEHPKILEFLDFYETGRFVYLVTKFYEGKDLFDHIDINVPYPEDYSKLLIREMGECVKVCHEQGVAHLDIKCENYMVNNMLPNPNLVLIDFGHAEKIEQNVIKRGYSKYGTSFYLCPEGYSKLYSTKSDIWSLGICAHLILSGDYPFHGYRCREGEIVLDKNLTPEASDFISKCLEYEPEDRFTIQEFLDSEFLKN
jgi:serine/threonine protein kinase